MKFTPERITSLRQNEIFVFGSNLRGIHGNGAAKMALERFGRENPNYVLEWGCRPAR